MRSLKNKSHRKAQFFGGISILSILALVLLIQHTINVLHLSFVFSFAQMNMWITFYLLLLLFFLFWSVVMNRSYIRDKNGRWHLREKIVHMLSNSCSGSIFDIICVFVFMFYCSWIPNHIIGWSTSSDYFYSPVLMVSALALTIIVKPFITMSSVDVPEADRTVLFTGISNINYSFNKKINKETTNLETLVRPFVKYPNIHTIVILLSDAIYCGYESIGKNDGKDMNREKSKIFIEYRNELEKIREITSESGIETKERNSIYPLKTILTEIKGLRRKYKEIEKKIKEENELNTLSSVNSLQVELDNLGKIIVRKEQEELAPIYNKICVPLERLIKNYIEQYMKESGNVSFSAQNINIKFSNPVDYNDFEECNDTLLNEIAKNSGIWKWFKRTNNDTCLLFNISPGTTIVSGVMTLNAIKGRRGLIYAPQEGIGVNEVERIIEYDPNVFVLDKQISELIVERQEVNK